MISLRNQLLNTEKSAEMSLLEIQKELEKRKKGKDLMNKQVEMLEEQLPQSEEKTFDMQINAKKEQDQLRLVGTSEEALQDELNESKTNVL